MGKVVALDDYAGLPLGILKKVLVFDASAIRGETNLVCDNIAVAAVDTVGGEYVSANPGVAEDVLDPV